MCIKLIDYNKKYTFSMCLLIHERGTQFLLSLYVSKSVEHPTYYRTLSIPLITFLLDKSKKIIQ